MDEPKPLTEEILIKLVKEAIANKKAIVCFNGAVEVCLVFNAEGIIQMVPPLTGAVIPMPIAIGRALAELVQSMEFQEYVITEWEKLHLDQDQETPLPPISPLLH